MITRSQKNKFSFISLDFPTKRKKANYNNSFNNNYNNSFNNNLDIESVISESELESEIIDSESDSESDTENESNTESITESITERSECDSNSEILSDISTITKGDKDINHIFQKEYEILEHNLYSILDGSFFEGNNIESSLNDLKKKVSLNQIQELNNKLCNLKNQYDNENLNIINMLDENYSVVKQKKIIAKIYNIINSDILTPEYNNNIEELNKLINEMIQKK